MASPKQASSHASSPEYRVVGSCLAFSFFWAHPRNKHENERKLCPSSLHCSVVGLGSSGNASVGGGSSSVKKAIHFPVEVNATTTSLDLCHLFLLCAGKNFTSWQVASTTTGITLTWLAHVLTLSAKMRIAYWR